MNTKTEFLPSTPKQNSFIFWHLGLDVKECKLSLKDAADMIGQMKKDPKFVYDYLIQNYGAKVSDSTKLEKAIKKKENVIMSNELKSKADLCKEAYESDKTLTAKQISKKVGCDLSVVYRTLKGEFAKRITKTPTKKKVIESLKYRQVLNHIKKTPSLQGDSALTLENLAESYNETADTNYSIYDFSRCMAMIVKKGYAEKIGRGVYSLDGSTETEVKKTESLQPQPIADIAVKNKPYEYAIALYKMVGSEEAHKLINMVAEITNYI